jgi:hypothetical protein
MSRRPLFGVPRAMLPEIWPSSGVALSGDLGDQQAATVPLTRLAQ